LGKEEGRLMDGYGEFEVDIPGVMRGQLPGYFATLKTETLTAANVARIPDGAQGAYLLFFDDRLVYVCKTDAQAGFRSWLTRHSFNVQHRRGLDPSRIGFKAVRIFVFSTFDLETMLIEEYTRHHGLRPVWNFSGFGSNDPGRNREDQQPAQFDLDYPVDIDRTIEVLPPGEHTLITVVLALKSHLPYLFRYETDGAGAWREGHSDMRDKSIDIPATPLTTRAHVQMILDVLPASWQATVLPNRVILYRETRVYRAQVEALRRST
jgi:hypothetical protein